MKNLKFLLIIFTLTVVISILSFLIVKQFLNTQNYYSQLKETNLPQNNIKPEIIINKPLANEKIYSGYIIKGSAPGTWFFEATFPIQLLDENENILTTVIAHALTDWMTTDYVNFEAELVYQSEKEQKGFLKFKNDNPSGIKEYEKTFILPVVMAPSQMIQADIYFPNSEYNPEAFDCSLVYPVIRKIDDNPKKYENIINELLKGPTKEEEKMTYYTSINPESKINNISLKNKTIYIDFNDKLNENVAGSCLVTAIRSQIEETLLQFSEVSQVVISVNGNSAEILQP